MPAWTLGLAGLMPVPPGLATSAGHGHEMLFGYALAVVAGYLLGPQPLRLTVTLLSLWLAARASFLFLPGSWLAVAAAGAFAFAVAARVVPRFGRAAKKWRNRTVAPVVGGLALLAAVGSYTFATPAGPTLLVAWLMLLSVLLFFMGGRIIAPAVAGHQSRRGRPLAARVQPHLEGAALVGLFAALGLFLLPADRGRALAGMLLCAVGVLTFVRLLRWRLWHCRDRVDLLVLGVGYAWLAIGMVLLGAALWTGVPVSPPLHALSVGAVGTLTVAVMARTRLLYRYRDANVEPAAHGAALLMTAAAAARLAAGVPQLGGAAMPLLFASALAWSVALLVLLVVLVRSVRAEPDGPA